MRAAAALFAAAVLFAPPALAQEAGEAEKGQADRLQLEADEIIYEREDELVRALGDARVAWRGRVLRAEEIRYDLALGEVTTGANAVFITENGDRHFGDNLRFSDDFAQGSAVRLRSLLADDSQLYAEEAELKASESGGRLFTLLDAAYSACRCEEPGWEEAAAGKGAGGAAAGGASEGNDGSAPPGGGLEGGEELSWRVDADRVEWDADEQTIRYYKARLRLFNVAIAYAPYLSLPDPTVERRSGFLEPSFRSDSYLGSIIRIPYYFAIAPDTNFQLSPFYSTKRGFGSGLQLEQLYSKSRLDLKGEATKSAPAAVREDDTARRQRGYLFAKYRTDINDNWRAALEVEAVTDKDYLREYRVDPARAQTSRRLRFERLTLRHYVRVQAVQYQSLRSDETPESEEIRQPSILPIADWRWRGDPWRGFYPGMDAGFRVLRRSNFGNSQRVHLRPSLRRRHVSAGGHVFSGGLSLQGTFYSFSREALRATRREGAPPLVLTGSSRRNVDVTYPVVSLGWRWPLMLSAGSQGGAPGASGGGGGGGGEMRSLRSHTFEPRVQWVGVFGSPNRDDIPNEESQNLELDRARLFRTYRYPGLDRVEEGSRVDYGASLRSRFGGGRETSFFLGQSRRVDSGRNEAAPNSGYGGRRTHRLDRQPPCRLGEPLRPSDRPAPRRARHRQPRTPSSRSSARAVGRSRRATSTAWSGPNPRVLPSARNWTCASAFRCAMNGAARWISFATGSATRTGASGRPSPTVTTAWR